MFSLLFISFLLMKFGCSQLDGEFWWLNDKFAEIIGSRPPPPKFEDLSEFDTDESARIVFRDENILTNSVEATESSLKKEETTTVEITREATNEDKHNNTKWPDEDKVFNSSDVINSIPEQHLSEPGTNPEDIGDKFVFKFPDSDSLYVWKDTHITSTDKARVPDTEDSAENLSTSTPILYDTEISFNMHFKEKLAENICTYMKKTDCQHSKGVLNNNNIIEFQKENINHQLICCILPLKNKNEDTSRKIYFPETPQVKRVKRSDDVAQRQRNILLQRRYANSNHKARPVPQIKIATPDYEYDDPYWNIKSPQNANKQKQESNTKYDYSADDYVEDYVSEVPRPGLTGLYSDSGKRFPGWTISNQNKGSSYGGEDDYDEDPGTFGYSTIDPRIGSGTTKKSRPRGKPMKFTTTSAETTHDSESHTISYQSNPNFNVLQDFKLLNLMRNKNKVTKVARSTTTETFSDNESKETLLSGPFDTSSEMNQDDSEDRQVFNGCGRPAKPVVLRNKGKQIGDSENGSHPWLALLVPTRKQNNVLCYASLIHPRAAISAAECVSSRSSQGEITLILGLWNLSERSRSKSRVVSTLLHPKYKNGGLNNNLAILHWKRPFKLGLNVQPVCLANPHLGAECMFVGWGGFDQAMRPRSRWQRASVHSCKDRISLSGVDVPTEAFCASVQARGTVTGIGGSLVCNVNGQFAAVGVAVSRESTLVLLPVHEWVMENIDVLQE